MPGPVSDSYNPEWGTSSNAEDIRDALKSMHTKLGKIIGTPPKYIMEVVHDDKPGPNIGAVLCENQWRVLRFACERAMETL